MNLLVVGLSHKTAPFELLEKAVAEARNTSDIHTQLLGQHVNEVVVVVTCNRVEFYAGVTAFHGGLAELTDVLAGWLDIDLPALARVSYAYYGLDAARHIFRVAAGLDSLVVGEAQILGQLRSAYAVASSLGKVDTLLHTVMQRALSVGKKAQTEEKADGIGSTVMGALLDAAFSNMATPPQALVVGTGAMAHLAIKQLNNRGINQITILGRNEQKLHELARRWNSKIAPLSDLSMHLPDATLLITTTGAATPVVTVEDVSGRHHPLTICDVAVPRDVDPKVSRVGGVRLINVETFARKRSLSADDGLFRAEEIVTEGVAAFATWTTHTRIAPTVAALRARADRIIHEELVHLENRLPDVSEDVRAEVARTVRRVVATLLHTPTARMKEIATRPEADRYIAALTELFETDTSSHLSTNHALTWTGLPS